MAEEKKPESSQDWDAARIEEALAHIEQVQEQIDGLRTAIPSIIAPLARPSASKSHTILSVRKAALTTTSDLQTFSETWTSPSTQSLLSATKQSHTTDPDLSPASQVRSSPWPLSPHSPGHLPTHLPG